MSHVICDMQACIAIAPPASQPYEFVVGQPVMGQTAAKISDGANGLFAGSGGVRALILLFFLPFKFQNPYTCTLLISSRLLLSQCLGFSQ